MSLTSAWHRLQSVNWEGDVDTIRRNHWQSLAIIGHLSFGIFHLVNLRRRDVFVTVGPIQMIG
jgi:hypothetical protein